MSTTDIISIVAVVISVLYFVYTVGKIHGLREGTRIWRRALKDAGLLEEDD